MALISSSSSAGNQIWLGLLSFLSKHGGKASLFETAIKALKEMENDHTDMILAESLAIRKLN